MRHKALSTHIRSLPFLVKAFVISTSTLLLYCVYVILILVEILSSIHIGIGLRSWVRSSQGSNSILLEANYDSLVLGALLCL